VDERQTERGQCGKADHADGEQRGIEQPTKSVHAPQYYKTHPTRPRFAPCHRREHDLIGRKSGTGAGRVRMLTAQVSEFSAPDDAD
jgi:hypothetical protein